jgi:hypothetical protein
MKFQIDKKQFLDSRGRPLTQSLFLEIGYNVDYAVYTLKDYDYEYNGKVYPSLKRLYLAHEDPIEYDFATTYLYSWDQWQRLCANKVASREVEQWRFELQLKLSSQAVRDIIASTEEEGGFQARKYVAERGWNKNPVGRPKKDTSELDKKIAERLDNEYNEDVSRVLEFTRKM